MDQAETPGDPAPSRLARLLSVLAKLGILRHGTKRYTYTSGRDRPAESLMPDVYDAKRDLTTGEDLRAALDAAKRLI